jgi:glycosyltransferase involved in cell wall biosynthesis
VRVALDLSPVTEGDTGVARYAEMLWQALRDHHPEVSLSPFAIGRGPFRADLEIPRRRVPLRLVRALWRWTGRPAFAELTDAGDVLHVIDGVPPPSRSPLVLTVHDVLPITHPMFFDKRSRAISNASLPAMRRAAVLLTTCIATADALAEVAGVERDRVVVAPPGHLGLSPRPEPIGAASPYILCVGAITPRKGFQDLAAAVRGRPDVPPVVVAGPDGWQSDRVRSAVSAEGLGDRFRFLGKVSDDELRRLYADATVVCHPSVAEGFGFPCLEAMAHGKAVVATDIPSVREIGKDAITLVPLEDREALADAIGRLSADETARTRLGQCAHERAAAFSWPRMADGVVVAYARAAAGG